jgi:hypothetical protein
MRFRSCRQTGLCVAFGHLLWGMLLWGLASTSGVATSVAHAQQSKGRVVTISEVTIVGRIQKPIAAVDVSRIQPKMTLAELRQPFLQRIEEAIYRSPF